MKQSAPYLMTLVLSSFLLYGRFQSNATAQQPPNIVLTTTGTAYIYSPFDAYDGGANWQLTQRHGGPTHFGDDWYAQDWAFTCNRTEWRPLRAPITGTAMIAPERLGVFPNETTNPYGNDLIIIDEPSRMGVRLAHQAAFASGITHGARVEAGQIVGYVSRTGASISSGCGGFHVHVAVYKNIAFTSRRESDSLNRILGLTAQGTASGIHAVDFRFVSPYELLETSDGERHAIIDGHRFHVSSTVWATWGWNVDYNDLISAPEPSTALTRIVGDSTLLRYPDSGFYLPPRIGTTVRSPSSNDVYLITRSERLKIAYEQFFPDLTRCPDLRPPAATVVEREVKAVSPAEVSKYYLPDGIAALERCPDRVGAFSPIKYRSSAQPTPPVTTEAVAALRLFNCDDVCSAHLNGVKVAEVGYLRDSGWIDISPRVRQGDNTLRFELSNASGGVTHGYQIRTVSGKIVERVCGTAGIIGCFGNIVMPSGVVPDAEWVLLFSTASAGVPDSSLAECFGGRWRETRGDRHSWTFVVRGGDLVIRRDDGFVSGTFTKSGQAWSGYLDWQTNERWTDVWLIPTPPDSCQSLTTNKGWAYIKE